MSHPKEYVITGALMQCSEGTVPMLFTASPRTTKIAGLLAGNELDTKPITNIPSFVICRKLTQMANGVPAPCVPKPTVWQDTYKAKVGGGKALIKKSCIQCSTGQGKIEFLTSGQGPLPPEAVIQMQEGKAAGDKILEQTALEENSVSEAGLAEGLIPIWGSGRDLIHAAQTGDGWGIALNVVFLAFDIFSVVAGALSFGTATVAMMAGKAGIRTALKAAGKVTANAAKKQGAKLLAKTAGIGKSISKLCSEFTTKIPRARFTTACFAAGTPIAVQGGFKNIEDIQVGDQVWSWDEQTDTLGLKPVLATAEKESDALIELGFGKERFKTTPEHPFWINNSWKAAGEIQRGDEAYLLDKRKVQLLEPVHETLEDVPVKVYNFEVADWHTYFVGWWMVLVHNASVCLKLLAEAGVQYAKNILNGQLFDKAMQKAYDYTQIKMINEKVLDAMTESEIISHKFTQLKNIKFDTAKGYIDELVKKYGETTTKSKKLKIQRDTKEMKKVLEVPPQKGPIPQEIFDYARRNGVKIREISGKALEAFNNTKFW